MKKRIFSLILTAVMLFSIFPAIPAYAADKLVCDYDRDGDLYSFYVKDSSGNSVFTVDLEPAQASAESFYIFNPAALGLNLSVSVEYGLDEIGNGAPCPIVRFSNALPGCCGLAVYVLLSEGSRETYEAALLCETKGSTPALVYSDALSRTKQDKLLLVNAVSGELYNRKEAEITQVNAFVIASDYTDASAGPNDCKVEEVNLDSLTLYFKTGEQACECMSSLVAELGLPEKQAEDYYYTENGVDYWYIPKGKTRSDAICVSPQESGYYAVDTYACGSNFFHGDVSTDLVAGDSSVFYMAFAEPVSECTGIVSSAKLTMIGLEAMSKYIWGIGVKETPTQKWFFMDYFDYVSAAKSGDWTTAGILFPSAMQIDGFIVCPMEYFDENFVMQYPGRATLLFADGRAAMRFMRQLEAYPLEQQAQNETDTAAFTPADLLSLKSLRYTYDYVMPTVIQAMVPAEDRADATRYLSLGSEPDYSQTPSGAVYTNGAGDVGLFAQYADGATHDVSAPAQMVSVFSHMDFFPMISSFLCSFISACDSTVSPEKLSAWMSGLKEATDIFELGDYVLAYTYNAQLQSFTYMLTKADALASGTANTDAVEGKTTGQDNAPASVKEPIATQTPAPAPKATAKPGTMEWDVSGDTLTITGNAPMPDYTTTTPPWVKYKDSIKHLVIEPGITHIGAQCFQYFSKIETVSLPSTVTSIGNAAFYKCSSIREIRLPSTVKTMGKQVFDHCTKLASIEIPEGVSVLDESVFNCCEAMEYVIIPKSVTRIGNSAFNGCYALTDVYYNGSASDWAAINIDAYNKRLTSASIHTSW